MSSLRVATNSIQESLIQQLNQNQRTLVDLQNKLSTGRRVTLPEDDPSVVGRTIRRESDKLQLEQYHTNNILASTIVSSSELHLEQLRNLGELALGIANSTGDSTTTAELGGYKNQLDEILDQALDMANGQHDGEYLFAGVEYGTKPYSINDNGTPNDPSDDTIDYNGSPFDTTDPNYEESEIYVGSNVKMAARLSPQYNDDIQTMLQSLLDMRNAMDTSIAPFDSAVVRNAASNIEIADDNIVVAESDLITKQMRLEIAGKTDKALYNQLDESIAAEVGADITELAVMIKQSETSYQAALASASRILNISLLNYI